MAVLHVSRHQSSASCSAQCSCGVCSGQGTWSVVRELFQPDVNRDEVIDAVDIQLVINQALALLPTTGGDINGDGEANAIDIQLVVNAVLGMVRR